MKRFILKLLLCLVPLIPVAFLPMVISLTRSTLALRDAFDLAPNEEIIFFGDSVTGCSITEYPNDNYRVLWRSSTPAIFALAMLKELERQGKLKHIKLCVNGMGYHSIRHYSIPSLRKRNTELFGLTWRYSDLFPIETFYSPDYLFGNKYCLTGNPLTENPPTKGTPVHLQPPEIQAQINKIHVFSEAALAELEEDSERLLAVMCEIEQLCRRNNIRFAVLFTPHLSTRNERVHPSVKAVCQDLLAQFRTHDIHVFDCRDAMPDEYFRDSIHLLPEGSNLFTPHILNLLQPLLNEAPTTPSN